MRHPALRDDIPSAYMGTFLHGLIEQFPKFTFTSGLNGDGRYCIFVHPRPKNGDTLPDVGPELAAIETEGSSDEAIDLLVTKIALLHG